MSASAIYILDVKGKVMYHLEEMMVNYYHFG